MNEGPIIQGNAVMFLRARNITANGRDRESEERDIAYQRRYCQAKADQLRATVVKEYVEYGGTGSIASRPVIRQMLSDLRILLGVRYVLVVNLDRLARQPADLRELEQRIRAAGVDVLDVNGLPVVAHY